MTLDLNQLKVRAWLNQFSLQDEKSARRLLELIHVVDADTFRDNITAMIEDIPTGMAVPIALYAERKVGHRKGVAHRLFKEEKKPRRAIGAGPWPARSRHAGRHETGSEGIIANIITQVKRANRNVFFDHPGPEVYRQKRIRHFVLVTDFIGTGHQSSLYLDAVWKLATTKSWTSGNFLKFDVVCYASTQKGKKRLENHPTKPTVRQVIMAPTLEDFAPYEINDILSLIERCGPNNSETDIPRMGYGHSGALIAFAHGMPNNAPRFLFKNGKKWKPLFPSRVTSGTRRVIHQSQEELISRRLEKLREKKLSKLGLNIERDATILVLSALKRLPRSAETVSARTGLGYAEVLDILTRATDAGWINVDNRLTAAAYTEFDYLNRQSEKQGAHYNTNYAPYFPTELRAPVRRFS